MARHRDIRNMNYDQEYDEAYDDAVYGHSVDDHDFGVSPSAEQYLYSQKGEAKYGFGDYFPDSEKIKEEEEDTDEPPDRLRRDSSSFERPRLSSEDEVKLNSVLDELRNVVGDQFSEAELVRSTLEHNYDLEETLNDILNKKTKSSQPPSHSQQTNSRAKKEYVSMATQPVPDRNRSYAVSSPVIVTTTPKAAVRSGFVPQENGVKNCEIDETPDEEEPALPIQELKEKDSVPARPPARKNYYVEDTERKECRTVGEGNNLEFEQATKKQKSSPKKEDCSLKLPKNANAKRFNLILRDKEVDVNKKYEELRGSFKNLLNLVVVGHVDAGKSTMMGHMLYLKGNVAQRTMHKYEQESKKLGKQSFMYAWVLDDTEEERSRGVTVDVAQRTFETSSKTISLLDAPGHRDFIPKMITGAARADVVVLVVDASRGGFEAGFESGGQTREHAILTRSLGLSELAVAINKLDTVDWSKERFQEIVSSLKHFLKTVGYRDSDVTYIPCSGLTGENLVKPPTSSALKEWYNGPTLLEAIDNLKVPERAINRPIRFCINDVYKGQGSNMCVAGKLETGYVQNGDRLLLMPQAETVAVKGVQVDSNESGHSFAGDHVTLTISGVDPNVLHVGDFLCDPQAPILQATKIQARIVVFNIVVPIIRGSQFDFHYQSVCETARVKRIVSQLHKSTGQIIKNNPRALVKNSSAVVELAFERPLCLEVYKNYKELGRFMLRNSGNTVAAGMVTQIIN